MPRGTLWTTLALTLLLAPLRADNAAYSVKEAATPVPKEVPEAIAKTLGDRSLQLLDAKGTPLLEVWARKEVPATATPEQVKNGLTYQELQETTLLGVLLVHQPMTDYRKQKLKPAVYSLRLGVQPMDGDHMGTAPYREFCLVVPIAEEKGPGPLASAKELQELSAKASGSTHPAILVLFPNNKPVAAPQLVSKMGGHWVLMWKGAAATAKEKAPLGFGLNLIGHTTAE